MNISSMWKNLEIIQRLAREYELNKLGVGLLYYKRIILRCIVNT